MKTTKLLVFVMLLTLPLACTKGLRVKEYTLATNGHMPSANGDQFYVIGAGDGLAVHVWKEPSLSGSVKVRPDGYITLPLVNEVRVVGMSTTELRSALESKYREFLKNPTVTIRLEEITSSQVYLLGQVTKPGAYPFIGDDTVVQLITRAGGMTIFAYRDRIRVVRRKGQKVKEYILDYDAILKGDLNQDILLRPGDRIIVP